ncbi:MAG: metallophosphoesterase family protein [Phycisphaerales bacterium]
MSKTQSLTRRGVLAAGGLAAIGAGLGFDVRAAGAVPDSRGRAAKRVLRFAHLTDSHIQPELMAGEGLAACLKHVQSRTDAPSMLVTGGDLIMDAFAEGFDRTKTQWELFTRVLKTESSLEVHHCLGNHDIWGWNKAKSKTKGDEKGWGKAWACEMLGMERPSYAFSKSGWRFVVLDSVRPFEDRYLGGLDDEQFAWLGDELKAHASESTVIISHIPIYSVVAMMADGKLENHAFQLPAASVFEDGARVHKLLRSHKQVKLCLGGHIHKNERIEIDGVTYICDGAVSGAWWKGPKDRCDEGYGVVDLFENGSFAHEYVPFGWKAQA